MLPTLIDAIPLICEKISPTSANKRQQSPTSANSEGNVAGSTSAGAEAPGSGCLFSFLCLIVHSWCEYRTGWRRVHVPGERDFKG
jgi:hypothetical protein